jgi:hypothetical protein
MKMAREYPYTQSTVLAEVLASMCLSVRYTAAVAQQRKPYTKEARDMTDWKSYSLFVCLFYCLLFVFVCHTTQHNTYMQELTSEIGNEQ